MAGRPTPSAAPTAGAATAAGVLYQATWAVLQLAQSKVAHRKANGDLQLTLEPKGGGGDVVLRIGPARRVVQLKTLSRGTWSLKDIVVDVLPDLYRAVDVAEDSVRYEFVTEGGRGNWDEPERTFKTLAKRLADAGNDVPTADAQLDAAQPIRFGGSGGDFWQPTGMSLKGLIDRVVAHLRADGGPAEGEPADVTRRKVWHLLARFEFDGGHTQAAVRRRVEAALLAIAPHRERVPNLFDELVGKVTERSTVNGAVLTRADLFASVGLADVVRADDRFEIARRCQRATHDGLNRAEYRPGWDVRRPVGPDAALTVPITVFTGDSGAGKSWAVYARVAAAPTVAVTLTESSGNAAADLQVVANAVWQSALKHDETLPLANVAARLATAMGPARGTPWLTACIDQVDDVKVANDLLKVPLEDWGVQLVVGCPPHVAAVFDRHREKHPDRVQVCGVDRFEESQLRDYLRMRLGDRRDSTPNALLDLLRTPILANIYCQLWTSRGGQREAAEPTTEYELLDTYWLRVGTVEGEHDMDELRLRELAGLVAGDGSYPWSVDQRKSVELDDACFGRLQRAGWLRKTPAAVRLVEVPHDRLLVYATARWLMGRVRETQLDANATWQAITTAVGGKMGHRLHRLADDWFRMAIADQQICPFAVKVAQLVPAGLPWLDRDDLDGRLVEAAGEPAVRMISERPAVGAAQEMP